MDPHQRARISILLQQSRYPDAEASLRDVLAQNPDDSHALNLMAVVLYHMDRDEEALGAITVALRTEPDSDRMHAWKALILLALNKRAEAMEAAEQALALDATDPFNWTAKGSILASKREWKEAEACAREALELEPDDEQAHDLLSRTLLYQGKAHENESNISGRLANDPENPITHCNAGLAALRRGEHVKAAEHFSTALRIDASCGMARDGLIESYRARSFFYRKYLAFSFRMGALSEKLGPLLGIGIYFVYQALRTVLHAINPRLATWFVIAYLTFVFWSYVARGLSTFFLLTDHYARRALRSREKLEALIVGGGFTVGLVLLLTSLIMDHSPLFITGAALMAQAIPASLFFEKESRAGRMVYGTSSVITWVSAATALLWQWTGLPSEAVGVAAVGIGGCTVVITTFLSVFGVAKR